MIVRPQGIYKGLSIEEYHRNSQGISNTALRLIAQDGGPKRYWYEYLSGQYKREDKKHFKIGSAFHTLVLEPDTFFQRYIIKPKVDGRTKEGKRINEEFELLCAGKTILDTKEFDQVQGMANALKANKAWQKFSIEGNIEDSIFWQHEGTWLKSRPDFYNDKIVIDLKTTSETTIQGFLRSITNYGYHHQAAMQLDALTATTKKHYKYHIIFAVEECEPYLVHRPYLLSETAINLGRIEYNHAANIYKKCLEEGKWPGHSEEFINVSCDPSLSYLKFFEVI